MPGSQIVLWGRIKTSLLRRRSRVPSVWEAILKRAKQKEDVRDLGKAAVAARKMFLPRPRAFFAFLFEPQAYQAHVTRSKGI